MQKLGLNQSLQQKLSPQQIQFIKLLQVPTAELESRIEEELEINPALEEGADEPQADEKQDEEENQETSGGEDEIDIKDYLRDDEYSSYKTQSDGGGDDDDDAGGATSSSTGCVGTFIVPAEVRQWLVLNKNFLPELPFTMEVRGFVPGISSAGNRYDTNEVKIFVQFVPDIVITPGTGTGSGGSGGDDANSTSIDVNDTQL